MRRDFRQSKLLQFSGWLIFLCPEVIQIIFLLFNHSNSFDANKHRHQNNHRACVHKFVPFTRKFRFKDRSKLGLRLDVVQYLNWCFVAWITDFVGVIRGSGPRLVWDFHGSCLAASYHHHHKITKRWITWSRHSSRDTPPARSPCHSCYPLLAVS